MGYGQLVRMLWRRKLIALLVAVVVMVTGYRSLSGRPEEYRSTATVALLPNVDPPAGASYSAVLERLVPTYSELIKSRSFLDQVAKGLSFPRNSAELQRAVLVEPVPNAGVLRVTARAGEPRQAVEIAGSTVRAFSLAVADIPVVTIRVIDDAHLPEGPVGGNRKLVLLASLVLGLFLGGATAVAWERLFGRIRDPRSLVQASGVPLLGVIPKERSLRSGPRVFVGDVAMAESEEHLRVLGTNFVFEMDRAKVQSAAITSLDPQAGKSLLAANLAVVVGELGFQVLLVDAHGRRPVQHELFQISNDEGLSSIARNDSIASDFVRGTPYPGVRVVAAGPPVVTRMQEVSLYQQTVPRLANLGEPLIVDAPPLGASADVRLLTASVGTVVLVVRAGSLAPADLRAAIEGLSLVGTRVLGVVLTWGPSRHYASVSRAGFRERAQPSP